MSFHRSNPSSDISTAKTWSRVFIIPKFFKPLLHTDTPEYWYQYLCQINNPKDLTRPLLSNKRSFADKVKILLAVPESALARSVDMRWLESVLEKHGHYQLAQLVRWKMFWTIDTHRINKIKRWSQRIVKADVEFRWILQREAYIQQEIGALKTLDGADLTITRNQLIAYETELQRLNGYYWKSRKLTGELKGNLPDDITRAFNACRSNPAWYLCAWMRQDCAERGGCCGRGCGCCDETYRGQPRGHCTSACGCCIRAEDRLTSEYDRPIDMQDYPFDIACYLSPYSKRLFRAYIWGLSFLDEMGLPGSYW